MVNTVYQVTSYLEKNVMWHPQICISIDHIGTTVKFMNMSVVYSHSAIASHVDNAIIIKNII